MSPTTENFGVTLLYFLDFNVFVLLNSIFRLVVLSILLSVISLFPQEFSAEEESKPLLRVFPIFRPEECEWAIRFDICLRCMKRRERYAQKIFFLKEGAPYREHGCYTEEKGFYPLK